MDLYQIRIIAAAIGFEEFHVRITFDYRGNQQDLGLSLRNSRMVTTALQEWQHYEVIAVCTLKFRALCRRCCYGIWLKAISKRS